MIARLSPRDQQVLTDIRQFGQLTSQQVARLHFSEPDTNPDLRLWRSTRRLRGLVKSGYLRRIERSPGGHAGGHEGYVYHYGKGYEINRHMLDIAELYVRLREAEAEGLLKLRDFVPEDRAHGVKADAYVWLEVNGEGWDFLVEVDRSSENRGRLTSKISDYSSAYRNAKDQFPLVVWVVTFEPRANGDQARLIKGIASRQQDPDLFKVCELDQFVSTLMGA